LHFCLKTSVNKSICIIALRFSQTKITASLYKVPKIMGLIGNVTAVRFEFDIELQKRQFITSWIVPHLSLSGAPSLALFLPYLISGPALGRRPTVASPRHSSAPPALGGGRVTPSPPREMTTFIRLLYLPLAGNYSSLAN